MKNKDNRYYIYHWIRLDTNKPFYVGRGSGRRYKRKHTENNEFQRVLQTTECLSEIILNNLSDNESWEKEKEYIQKYRSLNYPLINIQDGGMGNMNLYKCNDGRIFSKETREKMSKSLKGKRGNIGFKHSPETIQKLKETHKNNICITAGWNKGIKCPNITKIKFSKPVVCLNTNEIFISIRTAANEKGIAYQHIIDCCKGKAKSAGKDNNGQKLIWQYYNGDINDLF